MAHLLQRLIPLGAALAVWSAAALTKPFSHKLHLNLKLECARCHATAAASEKAADNNLPAQQVCRRCHDKEMPIKQPAALAVSRFNHAFHVKLGNVAPVIRAAIDGKTYHLQRGLPAGEEVRKQLESAGACTACHRGLHENEQVTAKTAFPQMADCLVCHPKIDVPFSCEKCHEPGEHLKPPDHKGAYVDLHSSGKANLDKASCIVCHGRKFTCLGCH